MTHAFIMCTERTSQKCTLKDRYFCNFLASCVNRYFLCKVYHFQCFYFQSWIVVLVVYQQVKYHNTTLIDGALTKQAFITTGFHYYGFGVMQWIYVSRLLSLWRDWFPSQTNSIRRQMEWCSAIDCPYNKGLPVITFRTHVPLVTLPLPSQFLQ